MNSSSQQQNGTNPRSSAADSLGQSASPEASRRAAAILEVLAGVRTASDAAAILQITANHYYLLERRALQGLLAACEPKPKGPPGPSPDDQLSRLQKELAECQRECQRQAALVRATQRAIGLPATAEPKKTPAARQKGGTKRRQRRPAVRALRAAQTVRKNSSTPETATGVEPRALKETPVTAPAREAPPAPATSNTEGQDGASR